MNSSKINPAQPNSFASRFLSYILAFFCASVILSSCVVYESSLRSRGTVPQYQTQQQPYYNQGSPNSSYPNSGYPNSGYPSQQGYSTNQPPSNQNLPNNQGYSNQGVSNQGYSDQNWQQGRAAQVTFQHFYDELYPYGEWLNVPQHGYVWRPYNVDVNWQPYLTNGRWAYTRYGWTWVSNYVWGWAPFHYGRWQLDQFYGWFWVPGDVWGPAWVEWRFYEGNYWWVPLTPGTGFGANFAGGRYLPNSWNVVPARYLTDPFCQNYALRYSQYGRYINSTSIINNTYVVNNTTYPAGPSADDVSRYVGGKVVPLALRNLSQASAGVITSNDVSLYAPSVQASAQNGQFDNAGKMRPLNFTPASRATQGKAGISSEVLNGDGTAPAPAPDGGSKSRPVQMPTPMEPSVQPQANPGKKSANPNIFEQQPSGTQPADGSIPRYSKPRAMPQPETESPQQASPIMKKSVPNEQPHNEQPRHDPQPSQERKSNPFEQPRQESRPPVPQAVPQPSQERKSSPFEQPRNEAPRNEQPRHESSKSVPQSLPPSTPPPNVPQTSTGKKGGGD
jgi:hypothetical protein